jgi:hypothetical protein
MKKRDSRKGKSIDECESDNEHEGEQQTSSTSKKHRVENNNIVYLVKMN